MKTRIIFKLLFYLVIKAFLMKAKKNIKLLIYLVGKNLEEWKIEKEDFNVPKTIKY